MGHQTRGIRENVELPHVAADSVHLDNAGNVAQLRFDDPVLDRSEIGRRICLAAGIPRIRLRFDGKHVDLAEAGRNRPHRGLDTGWQLVLHPLDALIDELARPIDVGPVLEDNGHLAQAVA